MRTRCTRRAARVTNAAQTSAENAGVRATPLLILGATVFGSAAAYACGRDYVLLEEGITPGWEFVTAFRHRPFAPIGTVGTTGTAGAVGKKNYSAPTCLLYEDFKKRNCIAEDGGLHLFPLSGLLSLRLIESRKTPGAGGEIHFSTVVTEIVPQDGGFFVRATGLDGEMTFFAEKILDTTSLGVLHRLKENHSIRKALCGMLVGPCEPMEDPPAETGTTKETEGFSVIRGRFDDEFILRRRLSFDTDWPQARLALHESWKKVWARFPECRFTVSALEFDYEFDAPVEEQADAGRLWCPSVSYGSLFDAFEGGLRCVTHI